MGLRDDPRFNQLASDVHEAVKQFDAVNRDRKHMNILAFVNNDSMCGALNKPLQPMGGATSGALE